MDVYDKFFVDSWNRTKKEKLLILEIYSLLSVHTASYYALTLPIFVYRDNTVTFIIKKYLKFYLGVPKIMVIGINLNQT